MEEKVELKAGWFGCSVPVSLRVYKLPEEWLDLPPNRPYVDTHDDTGKRIGVRLLTDEELKAYHAEIEPAGTHLDFKMRAMTWEERQGHPTTRDEEL